MRRIIPILGGVILLIFLALLAVSYLYGISLRRAGIIEGQSILRTAAEDYAGRGYVTNYGNDYEVWLSSNTANIGGTQYQCFITVRVRKFYNEGTLAVTTNQTFIWLDRKQRAKIIDSSYRPPLFPPRF